jgi:hypothetical protein
MAGAIPDLLKLSLSQLVSFFLRWNLKAITYCRFLSDVRALLLLIRSIPGKGYCLQSRCPYTSGKLPFRDLLSYVLIS